jgi:hypothetical protein
LLIETIIIYKKSINLKYERSLFLAVIIIKYPFVVYHGYLLIHRRKKSTYIKISKKTFEILLLFLSLNSK